MSLPDRDEQFLRDITANFVTNPLHDSPDDDGDFYTPENTVVKARPINSLAGHIDDLNAEIAELEVRCKRLVNQRNGAIHDAGRVTADLNRAIANLRQTERWLGWVALVALAGWVLALLLLALGG